MICDTIGQVTGENLYMLNGKTGRSFWMNELLKRITQKKHEFDGYKNVPAALIKNLYEWAKIRATYNSNAIEGNTLTEGETALIVEKNMTVAGRTINEHLEAINYAHAVDVIKKMAAEKSRQDLKFDDILAIHHIILNKIDDTHAGKLRTVAVRILGSSVPRPNYLKLPELMEEFIEWLHTATGHPAQIAVDVHLKFVYIYPFTDGNGRIARLLFDLLLLQEGYPLIVIENQTRPAYIQGIERALLYNDPIEYYTVMYKAIEKSLDDYLDAVKE